MTDPTAFITKDGRPRVGREAAAAAETAAFLLDESGRRHPVRATGCLLGRSAACDIVLRDPQVSGRHALIHHQADNEYVLVDMGSSNGTFIEGHQVARSVRLRHEQQFQIAHLKFTFCQPKAALAGAVTQGKTAGTVRDVRTAICWLLLLDIVNSTELGRSLPPHQLPLVFGGWFSDSRKIIQQHAGTVDKFLGDALFAYWKDEQDTSALISRALDALIGKQKSSQPPFRWILHRGEVSMGGTPAAAGERLMGEEVHFVFRIEKLAGSLQVPHLMSHAAAKSLQHLRPSKEIGK